MMAVDLHNCELLLPSQFFTPQDFDGLSSELDNSNNSSSSSNNNNPINQNASYLLYGSSDSGSELSSSTGSEMSSSSSTEGGEEEDDYIGELTRRMAQYMLRDEDKHEKPFVGSAESTLWPQLGSNLDSPVAVGPYREPSPPLTTMTGNFEKMKINEEPVRHNQAERFVSTSSPIQVSRRNLQNAGLQSKQALIDDQIRAIQFHWLKQEQAMKQMEQKPKIKNSQSKGRVFGGYNNGQKVAANPWYTQQQQQQLQQQQSNQQTGSEMRAVFLNAPGSRTGSCGTGVFLPRGIGTPRESRKKQGCATVLIPARVVQALKLHFEKTGVPSRFNISGFPLEHDSCGSGRNNNNNNMYSQQKHQTRVVPAVPAVNHQEMALPQEWTY